MRLIQFFNHSNLWVALAAACTLAHAYLLCDFSFPPKEALFVFFLTWCAYLFLKPFNNAYKKTRILIATTGAVIFSFLVDARYFFLCLTALIIVLLYDGKWITEWRKVKYDLYLRRNGWLKVLSTALAWTIITSFPLFLEGELSWDSRHVLMVYSNFFLILSLALLADVRDVDLDREAFRSVPVQLGVNTTKAICTIIVVLSSALVAIPALQYSETMLLTSMATQAIILVMIWTPLSNINWHSRTFLLDGFLILRFVITFVVAMQTPLPAAH